MSRYKCRIMTCLISHVKLLRVVSILITSKMKLIKLITLLLHDNGMLSVYFHVSHFKIRVNYPLVTLNKSHSYFCHPKTICENAPLVFPVTI